MSTKRSSKESQDTEEILNLLKRGNEWIQKILEQIDRTLSVSTPDLKKSWYLSMEASVKEIDPSLWGSFQQRSYQMIAYYTLISLLLSSRVLLDRQSHGTSFAMFRQEFPRVRPHRCPLFRGCHPLHHLLLLGLRSGSSQQRSPTNLSQYSLTYIGNVSLNLSGGAPTLSVTPTAL